MKTTEERMKLIQERTGEKKIQQKNRRNRTIHGSALAACLALVVFLGIQIADISGGIVSAPALYGMETASILGENAYLGYVVIGVIAFVLGVLVELLLSKIHERNRDRQED